MGLSQYKNIQSSDHLPIVARRPNSSTVKRLGASSDPDRASSSTRSHRAIANPKKRLKQARKYGGGLGQIPLHSPDDQVLPSKQINQALIKKMVQKQTKHWPDDSKTLKVGTAKQDAHTIQNQEQEFFRTPHLDSKAMYHTAFIDAEEHRSGGTPGFPIQSDWQPEQEHQAPRLLQESGDLNPGGQGAGAQQPHLEAIIQQFIKPIDHLLHARSGYERLAPMADLKAIAMRLKRQGHDPTAVDEVKAMFQRNHGAMIDQAIAMAKALPHLGSGQGAKAGANLMELWSNPVGRQALAVMAATGVVIQDPAHLWFMGHWCQREWQGNPRKLRKQLAETMFEHLRQRDRVTQRVFQRLLTKKDPKDKNAIAQQKTDMSLVKLDPQRTATYQQQQVILERQTLPLSDKIDPVYNVLGKRALALDKAIKKHEYDRDRQRKTMKTLTQILTDSPHEQKLKKLDQERQKQFKALKREQVDPITENSRKRRRIQLKHVVTAEKRMHKLQRQSLRDSRKLKWKQQLKFDRKTILQIESKLRKW